MLTQEQTAPWRLGGLSANELARRTWNETNRDDVLGRAAELAYYFFLALFPLLFFLVSIFGIIVGNNAHFRQALMQQVAVMMPGQSSQLVQQTLDQIVKASSGTAIWLGIIGALWTASSGMNAVMQTLNITYDVEERRPYWKARLIAIGLTIIAAALVIVGLGLILYGPKVADVVFGNNLVIQWAWKILQWPVAVFFVLLAFAVMYYWGPDVDQRTWHWISPGSVVGVFLWLVASFAFRVYLHFFNSYNTTYGALGGVIITLVWLYVTGIAILIGSEINAEIEHAAAERGHPEAKEPGQKAA